jgi:protein gp37
MGENSKIEWTSHTFNPWIGCTKVAPGCTHCYAEAFSKRTGKAVWGPNGTRTLTGVSYWKQPLKWNARAECCCGSAGLGGAECFFCAGGCKRPRVFCASLADVFEDWEGPWGMR